MFKDWNKAVEKSLKESADIVRDIWKRTLEDNFYSRPEGYYDRTYESIDAITSFDVKKSGNVYTVEISYDPSKLATRIPAEGSNWGTHTNPEMQGTWMEYGWTTPIGQEIEGAHAYEEVLEYVKSDAFVAIFKNELRKLGYVLK